MRQLVFIKFSILLPMLFLATLVQAQTISEEKTIRLEARNYCQCNKAFQKEKKKAKKQSDGRLFNKSKVDFNFEECLSGKRKKKVIAYLNNLDKKEAKKFRKKVKKAIKEKCPDAPARHY